MHRATASNVMARALCGVKGAISIESRGENSLDLVSKCRKTRCKILKPMLILYDCANTHDSITEALPKS